MQSRSRTFHESQTWIQYRLVLYLDRPPPRQSVTADSNSIAIFLAAGTAEKDAVMWPCPLAHCHLETLSNTDWLQWLEFDLWPNSHIIIFFSSTAWVGHDVRPDVQSSCRGATLTRSARSTVGMSSTPSPFLPGCQLTVQNKAERETVKYSRWPCICEMIVLSRCSFFVYLHAKSALT